MSIDSRISLIAVVVMVILTSTENPVLAQQIKHFVPSNYDHWKHCGNRLPDGWKSQDACVCTEYAYRAVRQQKVNAARACGHYGSAWQDNFQGHYDWCVNLGSKCFGNSSGTKLWCYQAQIQEDVLRNRAIVKCTGAPTDAYLNLNNLRKRRKIPKCDPNRQQGYCEDY